MSRSEIEAFFADVRGAFDRLDSGAVGDLRQVPGGIADGRGLSRRADDLPMRANHHARCQAHCMAGHGRAGFEIARQEPTDPDRAVVRGQRTIARRDGSLQQAFGTGCPLARPPRGLRCTASEKDMKEMRRDAAQ